MPEGDRPPVQLILLWHMHQPGYGSPRAGRPVLPWTRLHATKDGAVLVVGHSNTLPEILAKLGAPAKVAIDDGDFGNLFVVVRSPGKVPTVVRLRY